LSQIALFSNKKKKQLQKYNTSITLAV